jgi:hypothetical protein
MREQRRPSALSVSRRAIWALIKLNWLAGAVILGLLLWTFVSASMITEISDGQATPGSRLAHAMQAAMMLAVLATPVTHVVLTRLREIIDSVASGEPFVLANATRLRMIAWCIVGLEVMNVIGSRIAKSASPTGVSLDALDWNFAIPRILLVLLLIVLAGVFEEAARMREDVEGTV